MSVIAALLVAFPWVVVILPKLVTSIVEGSPLASIVAIWSLAFGCIAPVALDPGFYQGLSTSPSNTSALAWQLFLAVAMLLCLALLLAVPQRGWRTSRVALAAVALWGVLAVSSVIQGQNVMNLGITIGIALIVGSSQASCENLLWHGRAILRTVIALSLALWALAPNDVMRSAVGGGRDLLGIGQLMGATTHPNALGPIAAVAFLIEIFNRPQSRYRGVFMVAALVCLVFAQSRSGWAAALVGLLVLWGARGEAAHARTARLAVMVPAGLATVGVLLLGIQSIDADVLLSGRVQIWTTLWPLFLSSPIIGHGIEVLSVENRSGMGWIVSEHAGQAHNQVVQTLIDSGLLGVIALCTLTAVLFGRALNSATMSRPLLLAVLSAGGVVTLVEAPLKSQLSGVSFVVILILALLSSREATPAGASRYERPGHPARRPITSAGPLRAARDMRKPRSARNSIGLTGQASMSSATCT